jgi:hypothetical protein
MRSTLLRLADLKVILEDLLGKRREVLLGTPAGVSYEPKLKKKLAAIQALPGSFTKTNARPHAKKLAKADAFHDECGEGIWHVTEAYLTQPNVSSEVREAAERNRATFIPVLRELQADYAAEADKAKKRKEILSDHEADLKLFPIAGGKTLYDWVNDFIEAGITLDEILSDRADVKTKNSRKDAGALRTSTLRLLGNFRLALADDVRHDDELPHDIDARIFGYLDELQAMRRTPAGSSAPDDEETGGEDDANDEDAGDPGTKKDG